MTPLIGSFRATIIYMGDHHRGGFSKGISFDEFYARTFIDVDNPMWRNGQTHILGGNAKEEALSHIRKRLETGRLILLFMNDSNILTISGSAAGRKSDTSAGLMQ